MVIMTKKYFFYDYYDKEYFKNNIKITILLKPGLKIILKPQLLTVVLRKYEKFKTTVTNDGFLHLKKKSMWMFTLIQNISWQIFWNEYYSYHFFFQQMDYFGLKLKLYCD